MAVTELRIVEERCDRCELLISKKHLGADDEVVSEKEQAENKGPFILKDGGGAIIIRYDVVCDRCDTLLHGLIDKMGTVNRGTRKRKPVEKKFITNPEAKKKVAKKKTPKKLKKKK